MSEIKEDFCSKTFGGLQKVFTHQSKETQCEMRFAVFLPPQVLNTDVRLPVLYVLSGMTCNETNFIQKAGAQKYAAEYGIIIVCPDTSPRNLKYEDNFGDSAGWYVDATVEPWNTNYRMYSYIISELISIVDRNFPTIPEKRSIMGHSMGGNGAMICALKNPGVFKSVSSLAGVANPSKCPLGVKYFTGFLGPDESKWKEWDATELVKTYKGPRIEFLIEQGSADHALETNLLPNNLVQACKDANFPYIYNFREGYDHGYYFIPTFIHEHMAYHAKFLKNE